MSPPRVLEQLQLELPIPQWEDGEAETPEPNGRVVVIDLVEDDDQAERVQPL
jgi:hypothetical protein